MQQEVIWNVILGRQSQLRPQSFGQEDENVVVFRDATQLCTMSRFRRENTYWFYICISFFSDPDLMKKWETVFINIEEKGVPTILTMQYNFKNV